MELCVSIGEENSLSTHIPSGKEWHLLSLELRKQYDSQSA